VEAPLCPQADLTPQSQTFRVGRMSLMVASTGVMPERELSVGEVNGMVARAFGKRFTGSNFMHDGDITEGILSEQDRLGVIGTKGFGSSQLFNRVAGYFGDVRGAPVDGSVITVRPKYVVSAIKYAQEYEALTGRRVRICLL